MIKDIDIGNVHTFVQASTALQKRQFALVGAYQTEEEARSFLNGDASIFDEIEAWLKAETRGPVVARRDDEFAHLWIALDDDRDWLELHLRWSERMTSAIRQRSS